MSLSNSLVEQFVKVTTNKDESTKESTVYGTIVKSGNTDFVQLDGSELLTPVTSTISVKNGDRVTVMIKNHTAVVTGNISSPSPSGSDLDDVENNLGNQITELGTVIATKVSADELEVEKGRIDNLITDTVLIKEELVANSAIIEDLQAEDVEINGTLTALNGQIQNLDATKIDADIVEATYATIENLEATNLDVYNLNADYASFKNTTTESLTAINANIEYLDTTKLDAEYANLHYANIDFANIGSAAIENFFSKSGMIEDLVVSSGTITGKLVGVTIVGDLIEGGTVKADKLVVQGSDGLYYKLNVTGETVAAEQTEYNSLNGSIITAQSITAEKISVNDLVAFGATIGGFKITSDSIYSGVKSSAINTTRGVFMNDDGEFSIGDSNNYLRFFKDTDGAYKLAISANSIKFGASSIPFIVDTVEEFYLSTSRTALSGGSWSESAPTVTTGHYIWRRNKVTYSDDSIVYTPSENGVCISGNDGQDGQPGSPGVDGTSVTITSTSVTYQASTSGTTVPTGSWTTSIPTVSAGQYLWTKTIVNYSDGKSTTAYSVGRMGQNGASGEDGLGIQSTTITYQAGSSQTTAPTGNWTTTIPSLTTALPYLWTRTVITYTNSTISTSYSVSSTLDGVEIGGRNILRKTKTFEDEGLDNANGGFIYGAPIVDEVYKEFTVRGYDNIQISSNLLQLSNYCVTDIDYGEIFTFSFYAKGTISNFNSFFYGDTGYVKAKPIAGSNGVTIQGGFSDGKAPIAIDEEWKRYWVTYQLDDDEDYDISVPKFLLLRSNGNTVENANCYVCGEKLEKGNKVTDWTPAPEDAQQGIDQAQTAADSAQDSADQAKEQAAEAESSVQILKDSISMLITDSNGESMMTQTSDGWTFNMSQIEENIDTAMNGLDELAGTVSEANQTISELDSLTKDLIEKTAYITMAQDDEGNPYIELGRSDVESSELNFKVRITNTSMDFMQGTSRIAYVSNNMLYIEKALIKNELQIGEGTGFIWKKRSNGNMGLRWVGG